MTIVVGTTLHAYVTDQPDTCLAWLYNAEALQASHPDGVKFFAALETDARGLAPFAAVIARLEAVGGEYWTFSLEDGRTEVTTSNRLRHITMGQNLVTDYCVSNLGTTHLLFMAADCAPPPDALPKLLELDHALVGGEVTTYCLSGPSVSKFPFPVEEHMATAAFILIRRDIFNVVRWRWDERMSDDPCMHHDALTFHGVTTYVRKDCVGRHYPEAIPAIEERGHDRKVYR